jgi:neutral trehalase
MPKYTHTEQTNKKDKIKIKRKDKIKKQDPIPKITKAKRAQSMTQVVEYIQSKHKALTSNTSTKKK